jgi:ribosomal protein S18 acetylase RimI-like enzyme
VDVDIRSATPDDLPALLALLDELGAWLQSIGMTKQWPASFSDNPDWVQSYRGWIAEGNVFVAERDGALLGTYRLTEMDRIAWPEAAPDEACYLHTLGVSRSVAASGLGNALLDHSCEITKQRGFPELRLDCWDGNVRLRRFYAEAGFEYRGDTSIKMEAPLFEATDYVVSLFARVIQTGERGE